MKYIIIIALFLGLGNAVNAQDYKVIVNSGNSISTLSKDEVSDFFLQKKTKWSSGNKVVAVDQKSKSSVRVSFSKGVHGKPVSAIKSYWQQALFSGKGVPPNEMSTDAEVIAFVKSNPGAIGYVSSGSNTSGVKVLSVN
jgi:ABC-type phosphate transport system substrate-binding protein